MFVVYLPETFLTTQKSAAQKIITKMVLKMKLEVNIPRKRYERMANNLKIQVKMQATGWLLYSKLEEMVFKKLFG